MLDGAVQVNREANWTITETFEDPGPQLVHAVPLPNIAGSSPSMGYDDRCVCLELREESLLERDSWINQSRWRHGGPKSVFPSLEADSSTNSMKRLGAGRIISWSVLILGVEVDGGTF